MASSFPSSLDVFTNPSSTDALDSVSVPHATQHSDLNDAVEALEAKVGADGSAVVSSHDYKIAQLEALGTPVAYTPSHTNITVGNGTEVARYVQLNKLIFVSYQLTWGSTTSFGGAISVGLPAAANGAAFGSATLTDAGTSNFTALVQVEPSGSVAIVRTDSISGSYVRWDNPVTGTAPFTWTTSDVLKLSLVYEAA